MSNLRRISLSIEEPLLKRLEKLVQEYRYANRSEFVRDMIRERLVAQEWEQDQEVVGTITLLYNHHIRQLSEKLTSLQHHHHTAILVTTHVHLDEHLCVEVILARGRAEHIRDIVNQLRQQKGVLHTALTMSSTGLQLD